MFPVVEDGAASASACAPAGGTALAEGTPPPPRVLAHLREHVRENLQSLVGVEDVGGIELLGMMRGLMRVYQIAEAQASQGVELSGPRWGILLRLAADEQHHVEGGLTPTALSRFHGVSKNTISCLLRGLEEQGYIERTIDPEDYRAFRIRLTDAGRELVRSTAPERFGRINALASELSAEERERLIELMEKLYDSIVAHI